MLMVRAIVRPEKIDEVFAGLMYAGFPAVTKMDVFGRGKQRGMKAGEVTYDELPKEMILMVIEDQDKDLSSRPSSRPPAPTARGRSGTGRFSFPRSRKPTPCRVGPKVFNALPIIWRTS